MDAETPPDADNWVDGVHRLGENLVALTPRARYPPPVLSLPGAVPRRRNRYANLYLPLFSPARSCIQRANNRDVFRCQIAFHGGGNRFRENLLRDKIENPLFPVYDVSSLRDGI